MKYDRRAIRRVRIERQLDTNAIAQRTRLSRQTVAYLDKGRTVPRADTLARIATALEVPIAAFFSEGAA